MPETGYKKVVIVDKMDNVIGAECLLEAKEKGLIRRASRVYLFNNQNQLLMQRRSDQISMPLQIDQSAAGHVDEGETYREAAERELREELGISGLELEEIATSIPTPGFFSGIYRAVVEENIPLDINSTEVDSVFWWDIEHLETELAVNPGAFTASFIMVWPLIRDKIIPS